MQVLSLDVGRNVGFEGFRFWSSRVFVGRAGVVVRFACFGLCGADVADYKLTQA